MSAIPTPVDLERVRTMLDRQNLGFTAPEADAWAVSSPDARYLWRVQNSEVLHISGQWHGVASTTAMLRDLQRVIRRCNSTRAMPKSYTLPLEGNNYGLMAECAIATRGGLSSEQFFNFCEDSLGALVDFFADTAAELPHFVTWRAAV